MEKSRFNKMFTGLCLAFSNSYSDELRDIYFESLKEYPDDKIIQSISTAIKTCKFFPRVAEIVELICDYNPGVMWSRVMQVAMHGGMGYELLSDRECEIVMEMGGMRSFQDASEEGLPFLRKEFEKKVEDSRGLRCSVFPVEERVKKMGFAAGSIVLLKEKSMPGLPVALRGMLSAALEKSKEESQ